MSVGSLLFINKKAAIDLLAEYGIENYQIPELPPYAGDRRIKPSEREGYEETLKAYEKIVLDVSDRLGSNFDEFVNRLVKETKSWEYSGECRLTEVEFLEDKAAATAKCHMTGYSEVLPMRFRIVGGMWKFDGMDNDLFFDSLREPDDNK